MHNPFLTQFFGSVPLKSLCTKIRCLSHNLRVKVAQGLRVKLLKVFSELVDSTAHLGHSFGSVVLG